MDYRTYLSFRERCPEFAERCDLVLAEEHRARHQHLRDVHYEMAIGLTMPVYDEERVDYDIDEELAARDPALAHLQRRPIPVIRGFRRHKPDIKALTAELIRYDSTWNQPHHHEVHLKNLDSIVDEVYTEALQNRQPISKEAIRSAIVQKFGGKLDTEKLQ